MTYPRLIPSVLLIAIALFGAVYVYFQSEEFARGPVLVIETPTSGSTISLPLVTIEGYVQNVSHVALNGYQIFADSEGRFSEQLLLPPGYTIIVGEAQDRFNRSTESTLELVYNAKKESSGR